MLRGSLQSLAPWERRWARSLPRFLEGSWSCQAQGFPGRLSRGHLKVLGACCVEAGDAGGCGDEGGVDVDCCGVDGGVDVLIVAKVDVGVGFDVESER